MLCDAVLSSALSAGALLTVAVGTLFILQAGRAIKSHRRATSELLCPLRTACPEHGCLDVGNIESSWLIYGASVRKCGVFKHLAFLLW